MSRTSHILHIADSNEALASFASLFALSGLRGELHGINGIQEAFMFLSRLGGHVHAPRPRLIILDHTPGADVWAFLRVLKDSRRLSTIPVAILTDHPRYVDVLRCSDLPVDDSIVRPTDPQEFIDLLASFGHWLEGSSTGSSSYMQEV